MELPGPKTSRRSSAGAVHRCKSASHLAHDLGRHGQIVVQVALKVHLLALVQVHVPACVLDTRLGSPATSTPTAVSCMTGLKLAPNYTTSTLVLFGPHMNFLTETPRQGLYMTCGATAGIGMRQMTSPL